MKLEKFIVHSAEQAEEFLGWLRSWRIKSDVQFRFLFTGSVGLQSLLEMQQLSPHMNDCYDYQLGPFKPAQKGFAPEIQELAMDIVEEIVKRLPDKNG